MKTLAEIYEYYAKNRDEFPYSFNILYHKYLPEYLAGHDILTMCDSDDFIFASLKEDDEDFTAFVHMNSKKFLNSFDYNLGNFSVKYLNHRIDFDSEKDILNSYIDCTYHVMCIFKNYAEHYMGCIDGNRKDVMD